MNGYIKAMIALIIIDIIATIFFITSAECQTLDIKTYIPKGVDRLSDMVYKEADNTPEIPKWYYYSLIEQESCISLTHSKCWNEKSRLKTSREEGAGLGQITKAYTKTGKLRFDKLTELKNKYKDLRELSWSNVYSRPDLQIRAIVRMIGNDYNKLYTVKDSLARLAMTDAAYNGGIGGVIRERTSCGVLRNCNPQYWFDNVEKIKIKSTKAIYGNRSPWYINREHVTNVMRVRNNKYKNYLLNKYN